MRVDMLPFGRNQPFYHVLVDERDRPGAQTTYVAQVRRRRGLAPAETPATAWCCTGQRLAACMAMPCRPAAPQCTCKQQEPCADAKTLAAPPPHDSLPAAPLLIRQENILRVRRPRVIQHPDIDRYFTLFDTAEGCERGARPPGLLAA